MDYEKYEKETHLKKRDSKGKEDHRHCQQIKLNNFTVSLWDKKTEVLYPISTDMKFVSLGLLLKSSTRVLE